MAVKVGMVSLGCSKNQVDGEIMLSLIQRDGYELCGDAEQCDVVIINTCAFIEDAKRESIENILEFCELKRQGVIKAVVVTGCLAERYQQELVTEIPEADVILGIGRNTHIVNAIDQALQGERVVEFAPKDELVMDAERVLTNAPYYAYIKLADGCDNRCTYCAIPNIRGRFRSRKMENILEEPFFLTEKNANYRQALDQQLALKKQALSPVLEISDTAFIIRMLEKNHGLSFLPYLAVERDIRKGRILHPFPPTKEKSPVSTDYRRTNTDREFCDGHVECIARTCIQKRGHSAFTSRITI